MRTKVDFRSGSKNNYLDFCKKNHTIKICFDDWRNIVYGFNESYKTYILENGTRERLPGGFGEFSITKKKRKNIKTNPITGKDYINLPVDWKKTKEKGKIVYNFNYHTEGYYFGWKWFKSTTRVKAIELWWFKPSRATSRLLGHYLKTNNTYQYKYQQWGDK